MDIVNKFKMLLKSDFKSMYMLRSYYKDSKDKDFRKLFSSADFRKNTLLDYSRSYTLYQYMQSVRTLNGSIFEFGVYKGGTAFLLNKLRNSDDDIYLLDTFEGMPDILTKDDTHKVGDLRETSFEHVKSLLGQSPKVHVMKGLFSKSLPMIDKDIKIKFAHIDADIYNSVTEACEYTYARLVPGGVMVFDDYGWGSTEGAQKAVLDFLKDKREYPIFLPTRQCVVTKLP